MLYGWQIWKSDLTGGDLKKLNSLQYQVQVQGVKTVKTKTINFVMFKKHKVEIENKLFIFEINQIL